MMTVDDLRDALDQAGIVVQLAGDKLRVVAPAGRLTAELSEELRVHKPVLRAWLKQRQAGANFTPVAVCGSRTTCEISGCCILPGCCQRDAWLARHKTRAGGGQPCSGSWSK